MVDRGGWFLHRLDVPDLLRAFNEIAGSADSVPTRTRRGAPPLTRRRSYATTSGRTSSPLRTKRGAVQWSSVRDGHGCKECHGPRTITRKDLDAVAAVRGGKCQSEEYVNNRTSYLWKCENPAHPAWKATYSSVSGGSWCGKCHHEARKGRGNTTTQLGLEDLQRAAETRGGRCLAKRYRGTAGTYEWDCGDPDHRTWKATFASVRRGSWCRKCYADGRRRLTQRCLRKL